MGGYASMMFRPWEPSCGDETAMGWTEPTGLAPPHGRVPSEPRSGKGGGTEGKETEQDVAVGSNS